MKIGYARVSTHGQDLKLQIDALEKAGCEKIFQDIVSGSKADRPGLKNALEYARPGDILVTWKLDRLGRSLKHLIEVINNLEKMCIGFTSIQENIDTTTAGGKLFFHIFGAMAEFERELIIERTQAGLMAARARGRKGGRPKAMTKEDIAMARMMMGDKSIPPKMVWEKLGISKSTLYKYLSKEENNGGLK